MTIAESLGYTGPDRSKIRGAIDAVREAVQDGDDTRLSLTTSEAIHRLAPYIGTGGGGAELGELVNWPLYWSSDHAPAVGDSLTGDGNTAIAALLSQFRLSIGTTVVVPSCSPGVGSGDDFIKIASGVNIMCGLFDTHGLYVVTTSSGYPYNGTLTSVRELDDVTISVDDDFISFTMPELADGEYAFVW